MAEDIDMITLAYDSSMSLPDRVTNLAYIGQPLVPFLPKFYPKVTHPLLI